jgi:hypothetical protein
VSPMSSSPPYIKEEDTYLEEQYHNLTTYYELATVSPLDTMHQQTYQEPSRTTSTVFVGSPVHFAGPGLYYLAPVHEGLTSGIESSPAEPFSVAVSSISEVNSSRISPYTSSESSPGPERATPVTSPYSANIPVIPQRPVLYHHVVSDEMEENQSPSSNTPASSYNSESESDVMPTNNLKEDPGTTLLLLLLLLFFFYFFVMVLFY